MRADTETIVASWLSQAYAAKLADEVRAQPARNEVERIEQVSRIVEYHVINPEQVPQPPRSWPALVVGMGYCDQVNAVACSILSHFFPRAQLFGVWDPVTRTSPHAVGRVWSTSRHEWLYFDAYFDRPLVFRRPSPGRIEILDSGVAPVDVTREQVWPGSPVYRDAGWVMGEYPSSFADYLLSRISFSRSEPAPAALPQAPPSFADAPLPAAPPPAGPPSPPAVGRDLLAQISSEWLQARIDDLCGNEEAAERMYERVASDTSGGTDPQAAEFRLAARHFIAVRTGNRSVLTSGN